VRCDWSRKAKYFLKRIDGVIFSCQNRSTVLALIICIASEDHVMYLCVRNSKIIFHTALRLLLHMMYIYGYSHMLLSNVGVHKYLEI